MPSVMSKAVTSGQPTFLTSGDPTCYDHGPTLWAEAKAAAKELPHLRDFVRDYADELKADRSRPSEDVIADALSDACPDGWDLVIRPNPRGDSNWCYARRETK